MSEANIAVVRDFLNALAVPDLDSALTHLHPDLEWPNTGLPTLRGRRARAALRGLERRWLLFDVMIHEIAADGDTVLTRRTDVLGVGLVRSEFWVCGTFTLQRGLITRWHDHFSSRNFVAGFIGGTARGLLGR